jgi:hypothetical protein
VRILITTTLLTPVLVLLVSLASRRWGPIVGGRLAALPLTSGPILLIAALASGAGAARSVAEGSLTGLPAVVVFCAGYRILAARCPWPVCPLIAGVATVVTAGLLGVLPMPVWTSAVLVGAVTVIAVRRPAPASEQRTGAPAWELPLRMTVSTALVLGISMLSRVADPHLAGVLATFPALSFVLAAMAHRREGAGAAIELVHGMLAGLVPTVLFFLAVTVF